MQMKTRQQSATCRQLPFLQEARMYRSLLVPLAGSMFGEQALPLALSLARRLGATLQVIHVRESVLIWDKTLERRRQEEERAYLDDVVRRLVTAAPIPVTAALLDEGYADVADTILQHAQGTDAELLVMTTHGRGPLDRFWLGSVADALVRQIPIPVVLVHSQEAAPELAAEPVLRQVLILLDGSALAEQILEPAVALGTAMQAEYTLLQVVKPVVSLRSDPTSQAIGGLDRSTLRQLQTLHDQLQADAQTYLDGVAERLRAQSLRVQTRVLFRERPAVAILDDVRDHAVDLIALTTRARGGLRRLLLGSVADKVIRGTVTPVLVRRPVEREQAQHTHVHP
jgi:nucleotide-binding universal stress UspA family protein